MLQLSWQSNQTYRIVHNLFIRVVNNRVMLNSKGVTGMSGSGKNSYWMYWFSGQGFQVTPKFFYLYTHTYQRVSDQCECMPQVVIGSSGCGSTVNRSLLAAVLAFCVSVDLSWTVFLQCCGNNGWNWLRWSKLPTSCVFVCVCPLSVLAVNYFISTCIKAFCCKECILVETKGNSVQS